MRLAILSILAAVFLYQAAYAQVPGLPVVDFERYFPHLMAVSEEVRNPTYPNGVQWKFITIRDEQEKLVFVALTRREGPDRLVRVFLAKGPVDGSENTLRGAVKKFSDVEHIIFEIIDLRDIRTFAAFQDRASSIGWGLQALPQ